MKIPIVMAMWFRETLKAIKNDDFLLALDYLDKIYLRVFKWHLAQMRVTKN